MNPDGSRVARLTTSGNNLSPALSPDGTRVAFVSARDVWTMAIDGSDRVRVTETAAVEESPVWSPDGARLAFVTNRAPDGGTDQEIVSMSAAGGPVTQLTANTVPDTDPAWSAPLAGAPAGRIAFVSARAGDTSRNIYVMAAAGGAATSVTADRDLGAVTYQGHDDDPSWSPDGTIAYTHTFAPNASGLPAIWAVEADGSGMRRLTQDSSRTATEPAWSPAGTHLTFVTTVGTDRNIAVMAADGSAVRTIDATTSHDIAPDWQSDAVDPETLITSAPSGSTQATTAHVAFRSTEPGSDFVCSLDGAPYVLCVSPQTWAGLAPGAHEVRIRATDPVGRVDQTPAVATWTIVGPSTPTPTVAPTPTPTSTPTITPTPTPTVTPTVTPATELPRVAVAVARRVVLSRTGGAVPVRVSAGPDGSRIRLSVELKVDGKWRRVGKERLTVRGDRSTRAEVTIELRWLRALGPKPVKARVSAVVVAPSGDTAAERDSFRLLRSAR